LRNAQVNLWGTPIGAVSWDGRRRLANFEYDKRFAKSGIQVAPLMMPLSPQIYSFPGLARETYQGLPGLLSDSLPDKFGNALIEAWLSSEGKTELNPVEKLCYVGKRGMGALEFTPDKGPKSTSKSLDIDRLTKLASDILTQRKSFSVSIIDRREQEAFSEILQVGTSAGGARAKAVIAWNPLTNEVRSGQVPAGSGFEYWLLKFDGVSANSDKELADPQGYGLIEYAYYMIAIAAGIHMTDCRLFEENGRSHFMTRRFDRTTSGDKVHMQSLCAMAHYDFNLSAYSYEQALSVIRLLGLPMASIEEQYRRMCFNVIGRNQDDHVKNIAFLMDRVGDWSLSPAFDLAFQYNPRGEWTKEHQMSINGKRDGFTAADFEACAQTAAMMHGRAKAICLEVQEAFARWPTLASKVGVAKERVRAIGDLHRKIF
jgi:serine/threonine-protein kinase HipA